MNCVTFHLPPDLVSSVRMAASASFCARDSQSLFRPLNLLITELPPLTAGCCTAPAASAAGDEAAIPQYYQYTAGRAAVCHRSVSASSHECHAARYGERLVHRYGGRCAGGKLLPGHES